MAVTDLDLSKYKLGWSDAEDYVFKPKKGLNEDIVREMSLDEGRAGLDARLPPQVLPGLPEAPDAQVGRRHVGHRLRRHLLLHQAHRPSQVDDWDELPDAIKNTYEKLGIPEAERKYLAGVTAQYESEVVYHRNREDLERAGRHLLRHGHRAARVPRARQAVLRHGHPARTTTSSPRSTPSVWSGGSFIYVPPGVEVEMPLQAYFRINAENMGQFERTLIIADEGSKVHYIEGCSAPVYTTDSLHSAVVEIVVKPRARVTYTTIQNWSNNVFNLVTKRARVEAEGHMEWIDGNIGSPLTMKYPAVVHGRPEGLRRGALGRLRRRRPAPGRRRQDGPRRARDHLEDRLEVDLQGRRPHHATAASCASRRTPTAARATCSATPSSSTRTPIERHLPLHGGREPATPSIGHEATVSKVGRRAALLPDEPRPLRGAGHGHDRQRLHRAGHPHAARWSTRSSGAA